MSGLCSGASVPISAFRDPREEEQSCKHFAFPAIVRPCPIPLKCQPSVTCKAGARRFRARRRDGRPRACTMRRAPPPRCRRLEVEEALLEEPNHADRNASAHGRRPAGQRPPLDWTRPITPALFSGCGLRTAVSDLRCAYWGIGMQRYALSRSALRTIPDKRRHPRHHRDEPQKRLREIDADPGSRLGLWKWMERARAANTWSEDVAVIATLDAGAGRAVDRGHLRAA